MPRYRILFKPFGKTVVMDAGATLLDAAQQAGIAIESPCGGDGICGRCRMLVREGRVGGRVSGLLTREEIRQGYVLACQTTAETDLVIEIPEESRARERIVIDEDAQRFRAVQPGVMGRPFAKAPLVRKVFLRLDPPTLDNNLGDCQRIQDCVRRATGIASMQTGLKIIRRFPELFRANDFAVTATIGMRRDVAEVMDIEGGDTSAHNVMAVVDMGTSTIVVHLVNAVTMATIGAQACFNSQFSYGREVTARMIAAEKRGAEPLQRLIIEDINRLIASLAAEHRIALKDINGVVCAGNTAMMHFLLGLPTDNIRRDPFVPVTVEPPPLRAAEVGIKINPRGLLFAVPGIGGWVGGDITAGILATGLYDNEEVSMLIDVGTNGEIVVGNRDWIVTCSASAGPALEGGGVECGMMAQQGAIERVHLEDGRIEYDVIGGGAPDGMCGSGVIDLIAVLLEKGILNRSGRFIEGSDPAVRFADGMGRFVIADKDHSLTGREVVISQEDIDNVITAKAAIFAAARITLERLDLTFADLAKVYIAGGFGSYINVNNAIAIGLLPDVPIANILYVGNTSIWGATLAALSTEAYDTLRHIITRTTYYELMGSPDYVDQFQQARFLPHTDIELFPSAAHRAAHSQGAT